MEANKALDILISSDEKIDKTPNIDIHIPRPDAAKFSPMLQGTGTNKLTQISTRKTEPDIDTITGLATVTNGNLTVFIEKYNSLAGGLRISTHKLLDACTIALTAQNDYRSGNPPKTTVTISLDEYMTRCGKPLTKSSKDEMRKKVKQDLDALYSTSIEWSEPSGSKNTRDFAKMRICTAVAIKNGSIVMDFSPQIADYLTNAYIMQYPLELFKADERNPTGYYAGKKLLAHNSIDNNRTAGTANIISVRALLESCPDIPTYEEVIASDGAVDRRIKTPLENALNSLPFIKWEYSNSKSKPLTNAQLKNFTYATFINCYILFEVTGSAGDAGDAIEGGREGAF